MPREKTCCQHFTEWLGTPSCLIYINYILGAWGDWMWQFAVGLYLVHLSGGMLRLAAIFGFSAGIAVLLLGGIVGNWVDRTGRMKVVQISLCIQNSAVALCAVAVGVVLYYEEQVMSGWDGYLRHLCEAVIIILAVLAQLASMAYKIAIEKDWIVVISGGNNSRLANLNARTRAIDLTCKIMAPTVAGLVMTYGSLLIAAVVIAGWNVLSLFIEYALLRRVYNMVPRLAVKHDTQHDEGKELQEVKGEGHPEVTMENGGSVADQEAVTSPLAVKKSSPDTATKATQDSTQDSTQRTQSCAQLMFEPIITLARGWRTYARQRVVFAGISLAFLYMTVLGFDSITTGYIYAQDISEALVGLSMAMAGVTGIIGTITFTKLRRRIGLERTGLIAFNAEIVCLSLTVASVWAAGSPFDPFYKPQSTNCSAVVTSDDVTVVHGAKNATRYTRDVYLPEVGVVGEAVPLISPHVMSDTGSIRSRRSLHSSNVTDTGDCQREDYSYDGTNISIILFLIGIITSRVGLWMADLVVTQLIQQTVEEKERGMVNGVQNSLNMLMDMIKFILVIFVPHIQTFGYLIILSFIFICMAACFFAFHSWRERGHLFHFKRVKRYLCMTWNIPPPVEEGGGGKGTKQNGREGGLKPAEEGSAEKASDGENKDLTKEGSDASQGESGSQSTKEGGETHDLKATDEEGQDGKEGREEGGHDPKGAEREAPSPREGQGEEGQKEEGNGEEGQGEEDEGQGDEGQRGEGQREEGQRGEGQADSTLEGEGQSSRLALHSTDTVNV